MPVMSLQQTHNYTIVRHIALICFIAALCLFSLYSSVGFIHSELVLNSASRPTIDYDHLI